LLSSHGLIGSKGFDFLFCNPSGPPRKYAKEILRVPQDNEVAFANLNQAEITLQKQKRRTL